MALSKVLIIVGDASETLDTMYPYYRLQEAGFEPVVAAGLAVIIVGERQPATGWLGLVLILACLVCISAPVGRTRPRGEAPRQQTAR